MARVYLILYVLILLKKFGVFIPSTGATAVGCDCFDWQYCRQEDATCVDCARCGNGQGAAILCGQFNNTVCEPCLNGTYSALSVEDYAYRCYQCTKCEPDRDTVAKCTSTADTTCGPCPSRMFAYDNGTCLECSPCPSDRAVTRYTECAVNGAPRNYLCPPGSCPECGERNVTVNTSDGGWVTHTPNDIQFEGATEPTTEDTTVVAAVSISVAVIVGVLVILVIIFAVWLLWGMYCRRHSGRRRQAHNESTLQLMQYSATEEASEEGTSSSTIVSQPVTPAIASYVVRGVAHPAFVDVSMLVQHPLPSLELLDIIGFFREIEEQWSLVATALGIKIDEITEIDRSCNSNASESCRLMLDKWSKKADVGSWNTLIDACNRNFLHSIAIKLQIFFASNEIFCESDVLLWDYFVDQIKRVSLKQFITQRWCSPFDDTLVELGVTIQGQTYTLEDAIILLTNEVSPQPIVFLGEAGTGKTTMIRQLVANWCRIGSNSRFALVMYINVAIDGDKIIDLPSLINLYLERNVDAEMIDKMCNTLERQQGKGLLIILDGYDEIRDNKSELFNVFIEGVLHSSVLPKASLLFVCQPGYVTSKDYRDRTIEVPLLRNDQVELYVQRTVGRRGIMMIRSSPIWPMMHNRLFLAIACQLIDHQIDVTRLSTLTQLYHNLVIKLISDQVRGISYSGRDHSATVRSLLNSCAKASYEAMLYGRCYITDIHNVENIIESGLLVRHQNALYFAHYTFLEFFTAYHVAHSSDFDPRALKVNPSDSLLLPFISGLTGRIAYINEETDNSLVVASVCYSEAKSPVTGQQHSTVDPSMPLGTLALSNCALTPCQQQSLQVFIQECEGVKQLNLSGFNSNQLALHRGIPLATKSTFSDLKLDNTNNKDILKIFASKYVTDVDATDINVTTEEWFVIVNALTTNNSLVQLNLSRNHSIANDAIVTGLATSLTANNHLQTLLLSDCNLNSIHANQLFESLLSNSCLLQIDLSNNLIEQLEVQIITGILQHAVIQEISIAGNPIVEEVRLQLIEIVHQENQKITM